MQFTHENHDAIVAVVDTVHHLGVAAVFPILTPLLAVSNHIQVPRHNHTLTQLRPPQPNNGGAYHTRLFNGAMSPPALMIWEKLDSSASLTYQGATHVVYFRLFGDAPKCAGYLAALLLGLVHSEIPAVSTHRRTKLKRLIYSIAPSAVHGTAYFAGLDDAYDRANTFATAHPYFRFTPTDAQTNLPVTTLPEGIKAFAETTLLLNTFETIL